MNVMKDESHINLKGLEAILCLMVLITKTLFANLALFLLQNKVKVGSETTEEYKHKEKVNFHLKK